MRRMLQSTLTSHDFTIPFFLSLTLFFLWHVERGPCTTVPKKKPWKIRRRSGKAKRESRVGRTRGGGRRKAIRA
ncbi:hypothetical protein EDD21DRAFT_374492 [Dissophora ornata]|nr:hypothetical protein EDD21DRAFT_374492 [Dissophora ornata]